MATSNPAIIPIIIDKLWKLKPHKILDVGIGFGKLAFLTREYLDIYMNRNYHKHEWETIIDGIEIWPDFITPIHKELYNSIYIGNAVDVVPTLSQYDLICIMDVIEHLSKQEGYNLINLAKQHAKKVLISTPATESQQGTVFGNPYEKHISTWTSEELGGSCKIIEGMLISEIDGFDQEVHLITEPPPGWALYPLTSDIAEFLSKKGKTVAPIYNWNDHNDRQRAKKASDNNQKLYASTGLVAETIHKNWGIPRKNLYFIFHSFNEISDQNMIDVCSQYAGIGYLNQQQKTLLEHLGIKNIFHTPQYVNTEKFKPADKENNGPLRVGVALAIEKHPESKGIPLLSKIISAINNQENMIFDNRALRGPAGSMGLKYEEMPAYYNDIDVLLCTSSREGGPLPPIQAAACGVPTISTACGHMPEFIIENETGFLVEPEANLFMEKLNQLNQDRNKLKNMKKAARMNVIENWSVEVQGEKWVKMLEGLK